LSFGKAIISTSIGAEGIPVKANEDVMIADGAKDFISAVNTVLASDEKKRSLEKNAVTFAQKNLDNKVITKHLVEFYNSL